MKGFLVVVAGLGLGALILWLFTFLPTDHPLHWLGFVLAVLSFVGGIVVAVRREKSLNDKAKKS